MKKKFLTFGLVAVMALGSTFSAFAAKEDKNVYSKAEDFALDGEVSNANAIDNPLKGVETDKVSIEYTLTSTDAGAAWLGLAQFYNEGQGFANLMFWPQIAYNAMSGEPAGYFELGTGNDKIFADTLQDGEPHTYKYVLTKDSCEIYVDGTSVTATIKGTSNEITTVAECCAVCFDFITTADKFTLGIGLSNFWGELAQATVSDFKITAEVDAVEEESSSKSSPVGGEEESSKKEEESSSKTEEESSKTEEDTKAPAASDDVVVTAEVAKEVAAAAVVTSSEGKVLDTVLTVAPVSEADSAAAVDMVNANTELQKAEVKELAVLDLKLEVDGKNVTLLDNKINVNIPIDKVFKDIKADAVVAVYRVDGKVLSYLGTSKVAADKTITFATDHFSQYVFAVVENEEALKDVKVVEYVKDVDTNATPDKSVSDIKVKADAAVTDKPGKTGDTTPVMPLVVLAVVALGGVVALVATKKRA